MVSREQPIEQDLVAAFLDRGQQPPDDGDRVSAADVAASHAACADRDRAEAEIGWFIGKLQGRVPAEGAADVAADARAAAQAIDGWLRAIPPFHRGALSLFHDPRRWPAGLVREFGALTALVVRLECAHRTVPPGKTVADLERAVVEALLEEVFQTVRQRERHLAAGRRPVGFTTRQKALLRRRRAAREYVDEAVRAYAAARAGAPCVLPEKLRRYAREPRVRGA